MATVTGPLAQGMEVNELGQAAYSLKCVYLVSGLTSGNATALAEALAHPDVPQAGHTYSAYPNLQATKRSGKILDGDPSKAEITVEYERIQRAVFSRQEFEFRVTGGTSLQQIQSAFDGYGNQIVLSHDFTGDSLHDGVTQPESQGGEVSVLSPQTMYRFEGILATNYPDIISRSWAGYLNADYWANGVAGSWLCTDVSFELHDLSFYGAYWKFTFEFTHNPQGWQPVAVYNDEQRNRPPSDLGANPSYTDYAVVTWYPSRYFGELFPL